MDKCRVFILLLSVLAYVGGCVLMPARMVVKADKSCCAGAMKNAGHAQCPKQGKEGGAGATSCLDCPLCYSTILPYRQEAGELVQRVKKVYLTYASAFVDGYHAAAWKPPATV